MARYRRFLKSLQRSFIALFRALAGLLVKAARTVFASKRHPSWRRSRLARMQQAGFVLPTVSLILVVMGLVVGALLIRTSTRMEEVIVARQTQEIENAASPALDRARSKLEALFARGTQGLPGEDILASWMLNDGTNNTEPLPPIDGNNPFDLPDETRLNLTDPGDVDGDGNVDPEKQGIDNAWVYCYPDGDVDQWCQDTGGTLVAYSIIFDTPNSGGTTPLLENFDRTGDNGNDSAVEQRADALQVRNGPILAETSQIDSSCEIEGGGERVDEGWFQDPVSAATFRKNFQVNAIALVPQNSNNPGATEFSSVGTIATMEMQQDRSANRGNKWGAWFLSDLEIYPGSVMDWNGSMHTQGNLFIGAPPDGGDFRSFLVSSPKSCLFSEEFSELTTASIETEQDQDNQNNEFITPGFQGQFGIGTILENIYQDQDFQIDLHTGGGTNTDASMNASNDSIDQSQGSSAPSDIFLDPVRLVTDGTLIARHRQEQLRNDENVDPRDWMRADSWETDQEDTFNGRFFHSGGDNKPRVDDLYRADNRAGPKATYGSNFKVGDNLPTNGGTLTDTALTSSDPINTGEPASVGLDGYWERRARNEGLRVIVGERLQLEDPGIGVDPADVGSDHINRQRMTLQDKLGAAQATLFYHHTNTDDDDNIVDFPVAAMASTVHPGTADTLKRSATFDQITFNAPNNFVGNGIFDPNNNDTDGNGNNIDIFGDDPNEVLVDFFTGRGTNGWEFTTSFNRNGTNNNNLFTPGTGPQGALLVALENLAEFSGDPDGAFPPIQDNNIHPYPLMTKWGNFSDLRRALTNMSSNGAPLDNNLNNTNYGGLSIADKSTIQSASFMLGMLAYNISYLNAYDYTNGGPNAGNQQDLINLNDDLAGINSQQPEQAIQAANTPFRKKLARLIALKEQINFDRDPGNYTCEMMQNPQPAWLGTITNNGNNNNNDLQSLCFPPDRNMDGNINQNDAKYPALYYIFPTTQHGEPRTNNYITNANNASNQPYQQMTNQDIADIALMPQAMDSWTLPKTDTLPTNTPMNSGQCSLTAIPNCSQFEVLEVDPALASAVDNNNYPTTPAPAGNDSVRVAFKDSALFNGREQMSVRVLNMDLDMLANNNINGDTWLAGGDDRPSNLQEGGIVYAFREDAVREEEIARPDGGNNWQANCASADAITSCANDATNQTDPPLNSDTQISAKSVDFFPDPDRRPYGFRIKNGADLRRNGNTDGNPDTDETESYGLSLISDQPVYIQGDFNLHSNEEFEEPLDDDWGNFYDRENLDSDFATAGGDNWRYSEIISDAVTIISDNFCDGSIEDGIIATGFNRNTAQNNPGDDLEALLTGNGTNDGNDPLTLNRGADLENDIYGCVDQTGSSGASSNSFPVTSYLNQNIGNANGFEDPSAWDREIQGDLGSPIQISADGNDNPRPSYNTNFYNGGYYNFTDVWGDFMLPVAADGQEVNTVMLSGIVPSRAQQSFGGLHNFPRLLEDWNGSTNKDLFISGSLLQLDFSHYATAPFDAEPWDPNSNNTTSDDEFIRHYAPPNRRWGYDVGLQFVQPGPVSKRLIQSAVARNEYYSEPELDDPYVENLRCATFNDGGTQVDPSATCP
jgi:hypothetical protein